MTAPNIEMIAASLRNCSLGRGNRGAAASSSSPSYAPPPRRLVEEADEEDEEEVAGVTVELNSELPLPYQWEQCLDMRTGEVYYVNWENGIRTTEDPRTSSTAYLTSYCSEEEEEEEEEDDTSDEDSTSGDGGDGKDDSGEPSYSSGACSCLSSVSSSSPGETATSSDEPYGGRGGSQILVAAGCKACFMYFMVPKRIGDCPKCGGLLLHLGRNGCI